MQLRIMESRLPCRTIAMKIHEVSEDVPQCIVMQIVEQFVEVAHTVLQELISECVNKIVGFSVPRVVALHLGADLR